MGYTPPIIHLYDWTDFGDSLLREQAERKTGVTNLQIGNKYKSKCEYCKSTITTNKCPNCGANN